MNELLLTIVSVISGGAIGMMSVCYSLGRHYIVIKKEHFEAIMRNNLARRDDP